MTRKEAESLPILTRVMIDAGSECEQLARMICPDAKWTADMRGMAVVQRIKPDGSVPSWAPKNGHTLVSRRNLTLA